MVPPTREAAPALLAAYDFSQFRRIVDVGGGAARLIAAILQRIPASTAWCSTRPQESKVP
jgi:hypothetical protein